MVIKRKKALTVNPIKKSPALGAAIACYGIKGMLPIIHGSQGCSAFAKNILIEHFKEPVPLTNTAVQPVDVVFGSEKPVKQGLKNVLSGDTVPDAIAVITSGMAEVQGADVERYVDEFKDENPRYRDFPIVVVRAADFEGGLQEGYEKALVSIVRTFTGRRIKAKQKQVNLLLGASLTPGDIESIKEFLESFDLNVIALPDLADSLIGRMKPGRQLYYPYTTGGTTVSKIGDMPNSSLTIAVGTSSFKAAEYIEENFKVPTVYLKNLSNFEEVDNLVSLLRKRVCHVPKKVIYQREKLLDALADTHFYLNTKKFAIAAIPDVAFEVSELINLVGGEVTSVVSPTYSPLLEEIKAKDVMVGDMEDFKNLCKMDRPHVMLGSSHLHFLEEKLNIPLVRVDFPVLDRIGFAQSKRVLYEGISQFLFKLSNVIIEKYIEKPYVWRKHEDSPV